MVAGPVERGARGGGHAGRPALPKGAEKVHALLKRDLGGAPQVLVFPAGVEQLPVDMMQYRSECWTRVWDSPDARANLSG
eukprot:2042944-Pyramimonas_sp.AAC.1